MNMSFCEKYTAIFYLESTGDCVLAFNIMCYSDACLAIKVVEVMLKAKIWQKLCLSVNINGAQVRNF